MIMIEIARIYNVESYTALSVVNPSTKEIDGLS
jgi:hypothetical protein